jgi:hypothetical protein
MVIRQRQFGLTYLWMLFLVFLLGLGLGKSLEVYSTMIQREKEADLLYVGGLYREAIKQFYLSSPGNVRRYPERLEDLLRDPRRLGMRRYLRQLYLDPITGKEFEVIQAPQGGVWGVRSRSAKKPSKTAEFEMPLTVIDQVDGYQAWGFIFDGDSN